MKGNRSRTQVISRSSGLKTLARSVGQQKRSSIARQAMRDNRICGYILHILGKDIQREMKQMSSVRTKSSACFVALLQHQLQNSILKCVCVKSICAF